MPGTKPDFLDLDGDGNTTEPMKGTSKKKMMRGGQAKMMRGGQAKMMRGGQAKAGYMRGGQAKAKKRYMDGGCAVRGTRDTKMA